MSNTFALLVRALVFACLFPLSAVAIPGTKTNSACIVASAPTLNFDRQGTRVANIEGSAAVQLQSARAPEPGNQTDTITVTAMS